jgi:hypothetical protein
MMWNQSLNGKTEMQNQKFGFSAGSDDDQSHFTGSETKKVVPIPTVLSTPIFP